MGETKEETKTLNPSFRKAKDNSNTRSENEKQIDDLRTKLEAERYQAIKNESTLRQRYESLYRGILLLGICIGAVIGFLVGAVLF